MAFPKKVKAPAVKKMVGTRMPPGVAMGAAAPPAAPMGGGGFPGAAPAFKKGGKSKRGGKKHG